MSDDATGILLPRDLPASEVVGYARRAEELGFDELWVVEDLGYRGGIAQAAAVLASTSRIRVGIGILPAAARNVVFAAMELTTLAELFGDRVIAGVGHGMPGWLRSVGAWPASPLTLFEEYTVALGALLRGETVTASGRYVKLDGVRLEVVAERPPVVLAGVRGPRSMALAGRTTDGIVLAEPVTEAYLATALALLGAGAHGTHGAAPAGGGADGAATDGAEAADGAAAGGADVTAAVSGGATGGSGAAMAGRPRVAVYNVAAVDDDAAVARERVRPGLAWVGEPDWAVQIAPLPFAQEFAALRAECSGPDEFAARLPDEWVDVLAVVGTPDDARARIASLQRAGADTVILLPTGEPLSALEQLARALP